MLLHVLLCAPPRTHTCGRQRCHARSPIASCCCKKIPKKAQKRATRRIQHGSGENVLKHYWKCCKLGLERIRCRHTSLSYLARVLLLQPSFYAQTTSSSFSLSVCRAQPHLRSDCEPLLLFLVKIKTVCGSFFLFADPTRFWTPLLATAVCEPFGSKSNAKPVLHLRKTATPYIDLSLSVAHNGCRLYFLSYMICKFVHSLSNPA